MFSLNEYSLVLYCSSGPKQELILRNLYFGTFSFSVTVLCIKAMFAAGLPVVLAYTFSRAQSKFYLTGSALYLHTGFLYSEQLIYIRYPVRHLNTILSDKMPVALALLLVAVQCIIVGEI